MSLLLGTAYLGAALVGASLAPGLLVTRRLPWSPIEKLVGGMGLSFFVLYLLAFALFLLQAPPEAYFATTALCALGLVGLRRDLSSLWNDNVVRRVLLAFCGLLCWLFLLLCLIRHYSGANLAGDWVEHAQRMAFFIRELTPGRPIDYSFRFIGLYYLPARPPLENLVAAFFCKQVGRGFELFSLVFLFLNATAFLPACLMLAKLARRGRRRVVVLAILFALNPLFTHNATFTWTKLFAAFYALLGLWFYLRSLSKSHGSFLVAASASFAAGFLVHYSVAPYGIAVGIHHLLRWRAPGIRRQGLLAASLGILILSTWFAWSLSVWGPRITFLSNTTATDSARLTPSQNVRKVVLNAWHTLVPHGMRGESLDWLAGGGSWSLLRDSALLTYEPCLLATPGVAGGPIALLLLWWGLRRAGRSQRTFWLLFLGVVLFLGVASHGSLERYGVAQIVFQPLALLALTLVAAGLPDLPASLRLAIPLGCAVDFGLGVFLHFRLEHMTFALVQGPRGPSIAPNGLTFFAAQNWIAKAIIRARFWGDHIGRAGTALEWLVAVVGLALALVLLRESRGGRGTGSVGVN